MCFALSFTSFGRAQTAFWMESRLYKSMPNGNVVQFTAEYRVASAGKNVYKVAIYSDDSGKPCAETQVEMPPLKGDPLSRRPDSSATAGGVGDDRELRGQCENVGMFRRLRLGVRDGGTTLRREVVLDGNCVDVFDEFERYEWLFHLAVKLSALTDVGGFELAPFAAVIVESNLGGEKATYMHGRLTMQEIGYWRRENPNFRTLEERLRGVSKTSRGGFDGGK